MSRDWMRSLFEWLAERTESVAGKLVEGWLLRIIPASFGFVGVALQYFNESPIAAQVSMVCLALAVLSICASLFLITWKWCRREHKPGQPESLEPSISMFPDNNPGGWGQHYRVRMTNGDNRPLDVAVELEEMSPLPENLRLPLPLQFTHEPKATRALIAGKGGTRLIDVFRTFGADEGCIGITGACHQPNILRRDYNVVLCANVAGGVSKRERFRIRFPGSGLIVFENGQ